MHICVLNRTYVKTPPFKLFGQTWERESTWELWTTASCFKSWLSFYI